MIVNVKWNGLGGFFERTNKETAMALLGKGQKITFESILSDIKTFREDPMVGIGKFSADEELANHIFKRIKLAEPDKVKLAEPDKVAEVQQSTAAPSHD